MNSDQPKIWRPQPGPQELLLSDFREVDEVFYGGSRGGGKTDALIGDFLTDVEEWGPAWRGILIRRSYPELEECIFRCRELFAGGLATWYDQKKTFVFVNGAFLRLRYMDHDLDWQNYQGHSYSWLGFDELPQHPIADNYLKMLACARSAQGAPVRVRSSGNPGNPGQAWVKARFIDPAPPYTIMRVKQRDGSITTRAFIPARVTDNKILLANDPVYLHRLQALPPILREAWLNGDWGLFFGQFFNWKASAHVCHEMPVPDHAQIFMAFDYGFSRPFSVGWYWVDYDGRIYRFREWYGCTGQPNEGLKMAPSEIAEGIRDREERWEIWGKVGLRVSGGDCFNRTINQARGEYGPSIAEIFGMVDSKLSLVPADYHNRVQGWQQCHERLRESDKDERPMFQVYASCVHFIRTVPNLVADKTRAEDVDTDQEDHIADEWRFAMMSRPLAPQRQEKKLSGPARIIEMAERRYGDDDRGGFYGYREDLTW